MLTKHLRGMLLNYDTAIETSRKVLHQRIWNFLEVSVSFEHSYDLLEKLERRA